MSEEETNQVLEEKSIKVQASKEQMDKIREILANKNSDSQKLNELEKQLSEERDKNAKLEEEMKKQGGAGTLPSSLNSDSEGGSAIPTGTHEFDSYEEMVEWVRLNDRTAYEALKKKSAKGLMENKQYFEWHDTFDAQDQSLIGRTLNRANNQKRSRQK